MIIHSGRGPVCKSGDTRIRSQGLCFQQTVTPPNFVSLQVKTVAMNPVQVFAFMGIPIVVKVGSYSNKPYLGVKDLPSSKHSTSGWKMVLSMVLTVLQIVACSPTIQLCMFSTGYFQQSNSPSIQSNHPGMVIVSRAR